MLNLKFIQENKETVIRKLAVKNFDAKELVEKIIYLDDARKNLQKESDDKLAEMNTISKQIGLFMKEGKKAEAETAKAQTTRLKEEIAALTTRHSDTLAELNELIVRLPNLPHDCVPPGKSAADNVIVKISDNIPVHEEGQLAHWDLAKKYQLIDFEVGVKITGAGFPVYKGLGARLQRALIYFFLEENTKAGYEEVMPPLVVNEDSGFGTGQLPDKEGQMYYVNEDRLYLIPTAEVPVTNLYRDVILDAEQLPIKNTAYTACFRREAGSYGKDVRGLNRLHQFDKVEIVQITRPEVSYEALDGMVKHVESLLIQLGLPYRIVRLCGGDMSFTSALTYDFEVYSKAQDRWLEVSSVSNFEEFQANRLKLRFKNKGDKKTTLAHTLNGSSLALPRIVAALLENNQSPEGIRVPEVLQPFMKTDLIK
ncbi:serine--tRNA ligase [Sanguibacteroides justesenii]|uniref:Serine--tRNA ligase n=1 Tax=Sanguibacteroides justesenii TaxID=1547597 RepID=A0A0C3R448_9PORP|nr:serine--tRNA ligase [Sanguibacteroides justesenii]KIO44115.1 seryl-tRNA synthetase [Sanguibacteroides justesenii]PXZ43851.1 serine--tRNA ligase [Sanguibacteroides justesenii]